MSLLWKSPSRKTTLKPHHATALSVVLAVLLSIVAFRVLVLLYELTGSQSAYYAAFAQLILTILAVVALIAYLYGVWKKGSEAIEIATRSLRVVPPA